MTMRRRTWALIALTLMTGSSRAEDAPRVVAVWAAGPLEARVAYDRPPDRAVAAGLVGTRIDFGDNATSGDRSRGTGEVRGSIRIAAARVDDDGRTLVLATDPHSRDTAYTLNLPGGRRTYNLRGVDLAIDDGTDDARPTPAGWWPSLDSALAQRALAGSAEVDRLTRQVERPGRLTFKSLIALSKGKAKLVVRGSRPMDVMVGNESARSEPGPTGDHQAEVAVKGGDLADLVISVQLDGKTPVTLTTTLNGEPIDPAFLTLPWAPPRPIEVAAAPVPIWIMSGGDPIRGAAIFKGEAAKCVACHKVAGVGGEVGPDLSDLAGRDRAWVYRSINDPSAAIQPDYVPYTVLTRDGRVFAGIVRAEGADAIRVSDTEAKKTIIPMADLDEIKPSATSIMPVGLLGPLGESGTLDLIAFLTSRPAARPR